MPRGEEPGQGPTSCGNHLAENDDVAAIVACAVVGVEELPQARVPRPMRNQ